MRRSETFVPVVRHIKTWNCQEFLESERIDTFKDSSSYMFRSFMFLYVKQFPFWSLFGGGDVANI